MHRFHIEQAVGEGAFATVYRAQLHDSKEVIALKRFREKCRDWQSACQLPEIRALMAVRGKPNIIQILEMGREFDGTTFFSMKLEHGSLLQMLQEQKHLDEQLTRLLMRQLLMGLNSLHSVGYIHRDLKPENILVSPYKEGNVQRYHFLIADLGSSSKIQDAPMNDYVTTRFYRSPEMCFKFPFYDEKVDIWSCGCVSFEALAGVPLFPAQGETDLILRMCAVLGSPPLEDDRFKRISQNISLEQGFVPSKFPKQSLRRWFSGSNVRCPSPECISLLEKFIRWIPDDRLDIMTALRTEPFLH